MMKHLIIIIILAITGCNSTTPQAQKKENKIAENKNSTINLYNRAEININSSANSGAIIGATITYNCVFKKITNPDSLKLSIDFKPYKTFSNTDAIAWHTKNELPGIRTLQFTFYWGDSINTSRAIKQELFSDIAPKLFTYKVLNKWPHNTKDYTQGLEFSDGYLYEGTGQYGESMLYKINLDTKEVLQSLNLPGEVFGEGITIIVDKIYQLTWRSNTGFVYDKHSLKVLYEFSYPTEGWGLTNNGTDLIMSDGSENIYYLDTEMIQEKKKIQVYDNKGPVKNLNELEFIDGLIYANVYGSYEIVAFDANTGKVMKRINLVGILNKKEIKTPVDVLNGIAWDKTKNRLIVTGKWWPLYFQIELVESKK